MILAFVEKGKKVIAYTMLSLIYFESVIPAHAIGRPFDPHVIESSALHPSAAKPAAAPLSGTAVKNIARRGDLGGPTQPEMTGFHASGNDNMVDLFTGDFSYTIPLMDVGGYPLTLGYNSGVYADQEASWVGLGWTLNPGAINRNMRGLPDDFNGTDSIKKDMSVKMNKTVGVTVGADLEIAGMPQGSNSILKFGAGASLGVFHNTYRGWGLENSLNTSIAAGSKSMGAFTGGLSLNNNSQEGFTISPSVGFRYTEHEALEKGGYSGSLSIGTAYNSRSGMKGLQFSAGVRLTDAQIKMDDRTLHMRGLSIPASASISFAHPGYTPTITMPFTSRLTTVNFRAGVELEIFTPSIALGGYVTKQYLADADKHMSIPAYGYLNYQNGIRNINALLDFNREKEIPYRESPPVPHIAIPSYTYDIFSMSGEGTGGMFRAFRGDIGYVFDHQMQTRDVSDRYSGDVAFGSTFHAGVDLTFTHSVTRSALWEEQNPLARTIAFRKSDRSFEASYFKNPGEKTANNKAFYDAIGGDAPVTVRLYQPDRSSPTITTTNKLTPYASGLPGNDVTLNSQNVVKQQRDKRTQVISYLTAAEASEVGLSKYIESYALNSFGINRCNVPVPSDAGNNPVHGLNASYYASTDLSGPVIIKRIDPQLNFSSSGNSNVTSFNYTGVDRPLGTNFSARWTGRFLAPVSGQYVFYSLYDDGSRLTINDSTFHDRMVEDPNSRYDTMNLEAGKLYNIRMEYYNGPGDATMRLQWKYGNMTAFEPMPTNVFFASPAVDSARTDIVMRERRVNAFRKPNHISEIDVLNADGKRYVYGIPVYNLEQKESTFSIPQSSGDVNTGLATYTGTDDSFGNTNGRDNYYSAETMPAYAHSFLLTGILSPDYVDVTGDGITDDDAGDAIRFNYTKVAGINNPYKWRTPYSNKANYNEGLRTDNLDDKASYVYGKKELWYLNSVESKNMIAVFTLQDRSDLQQMDSAGVRSNGNAKCLKRIDLYTKADFLKNPGKTTPIKTVNFEYTYALCPDPNNGNVGKLTLSKVWFTYNGSTKGKRNAYVFNYNANNPAYGFRNYDRWGNYKSASDNPGGISNPDFPYALQDSTKAAYNAAAWTLDSIVTPSGSRIKVTYESDDYAYVQNKRAMQMFRIAGFSKDVPATLADVKQELYYADITGNRDYLYVSVNVPYPVGSVQEVYSRYLEGINNMAFRLYVRMPADKYGNGSEFVPCYGKPEKWGYYNNGKTIWIKLVSIDKNGKDGGDFSPLAKAARQFLRLNLPSKAYPGSDVGDNLDLADGVKILVGMADNIKNAFRSFDESARSKGWAKSIDTMRSFVRLTNPYLKKYGGGLRVKRVAIWDHWNAMSGQKESMYGQEYQYTTTKNINGNDVEISSGVASYEPILGGEENPFRVPISYTEQVAALAPVTLGYSEEPLGEGFFPAPSVGYSKVRVRSVNTKNTRSANGFNETRFYTTYDFPTITDRTTLDPDTKKRFKPALDAFLKINARHYIGVSQGFKIELNDMNGKVRSQAAYPETDSKNWTTYTENFYRVDDQNATFKHVKNDVLTINPKGEIDAKAVIGKDIELMTDMREERSVTNGYDIAINTDFFTVGPWPFLIPSLLNIAQREDNIFRSVAATKLINRHGILDSVVVIDKGSKVVTRNLLYDAETGDPVLTSTQNEYNDPIFNFTYPAGWVYDGMSGAYKNINVTIDHLDFRGGKIVKGLTSTDTLTNYFSPGDELLVYTKPKVGGTDCNPLIATFPSTGKIWTMDAKMMQNTTPDIYFLTKDGDPYSGNDVSLKIIRSGRRNIAATGGSVTMLVNPLVQDANGNYTFVINNNSKVITAAANEFKQNWKVKDKRKRVVIPGLVPNDELARYYTRNNCTGGTFGSPVLFKVNAATFFGPDKDSANRMALTYLDTNGQAYANTNGQCLYGNNPKSGTFTKNDCGGAPGSSVTYSVPQNKYFAATQAAADSLAQAEVDSMGQSYANRVGTCGGFYAKFTVTQDSTTIDTYKDSNDKIIETDKTTFSSVRIYFFKDAACTIPLSVTGVPVQLKFTETNSGSGKYASTDPTPYIYTQNFNCNGSTVVLLPATVTGSERHELGGPLTSETNDYLWRTVTIELLPNSLFTVK
ncbi:DUF5977 domain-containing protein [Chitinophaga vietnamensis]|uniref:DUF5977 domain-containing protein n=1 Tax=Chitinophaga vietnamensis TaxID=2593957 RepID=UPI001177E1F9|nr:DUF5977 domain-containing protein [Chitinophaga vietnamensis]